MQISPGGGDNVNILISGNGVLRGNDAVVEDALVFGRSWDSTASSATGSRISIGNPTGSGLIMLIDYIMCTSVLACQFDLGWRLDTITDNTSGANYYGGGAIPAADIFLGDGTLGNQGQIRRFTLEPGAIYSRVLTYPLILPAGYCANVNMTPPADTVASVELQWRELTAP